MSVLDSIIEGVLEDQKLRQLSQRELDSKFADVSPVRDALAALRNRNFSIIAEVKRSSPSKGALADIPEPEVLAASYQEAGASVVSVLTEKRRFGGTLEDLSRVREQVTIPVLRKDFIVNEYLVRESRAYGADLLLLIVAALDNHQLSDYHSLGRELGMSVLVEVHDEAELERALNINPEIIGVNSRNLKTLEIDLANFQRLIPQIPDSIYRIAESGIATRSDVQIARDSGADAILVGESLVRAGSPESAIRDFLSVAKS